jgi:hypothetical protein
MQVDYSDRFILSAADSMKRSLSKHHIPSHLQCTAVENLEHLASTSGPTGQRHGDDVRRHRAASCCSTWTSGSGSTRGGTCQLVVGALTMAELCGEDKTIITEVDVNDWMQDFGLRSANKSRRQEPMVSRLSRGVGLQTMRACGAMSC